MKVSSVQFATQKVNEKKITEDKRKKQANNILQGNINDYKKLLNIICQSK